MHLLLDHDGYLPIFAYISNGKKHDVTVARKIPLAVGSIVAMDRGYNDYKLFASLTDSGIYFVTRLKDNADYTVIEKRQVPKNRNILSDQLIQFNGTMPRKIAHTFCAKFIQSMSGKDDCWDNAVAESFFGVLKSELIHQQRFSGLQEVLKALFEYIEVYYNRKCKHPTLGYQTPSQFEQA